MTPPTQHDLILAAAVREAAKKTCEDIAGRIVPANPAHTGAITCAKAIDNMDLSALVAAHGNPTPQDAQDVQRSATVGPCEYGRAKFDEWRALNDHNLDTYNDPTDCMWQAWQAAMTTSKREQE